MKPIHLNQTFILKTNTVTKFIYKTQTALTGVFSIFFFNLDKLKKKNCFIRKIYDNI